MNTSPDNTKILLEKPSEEKLLQMVMAIELGIKWAKESGLDTQYYEGVHAAIMFCLGRRSSVFFSGDEGRSYFVANNSI